MKYSKLIQRVRELVNTEVIFQDVNRINRAEYAVIMKTFGISWNEIKRTPNYYSLYREMVLTEDDLIREFNHDLEMLKRSKEKGLHRYEQEIKLMLKGFLEGVRFFNPTLSYELSYIAGKAIY